MSNPRPILDHLAATVKLAAARSLLQEIITLADQAPLLTDKQLRFRLLALAERALSGSTPPTDPRLAVGRERPPTQAPGGQPVPYPADCRICRSRRK